MSRVFYNDNDRHAAAWMRGAGNAIVPQVAATFIQAFLEAEYE